MKASGAKRTEARAIPDDWEAKALGSRVKITSGESPSVFRFGDSGTPYFKVEQLNNSDKYLGSGETEYFIRGQCRTVPPGSVVFPKRGASIMLNKVRLLTECGYMDTNVMALTPLGDLESEYLYYALSHLELSSLADVTSVPQINNKHIEPFLVPLPTPVEQRAIAEALSDVDELISVLDKLIAKKRAIKQGAMQQLLSGRIRLPGCGGQWELRTIEELAGSPHNVVDGPFGSNLRNSDYVDSGVPVLQGSNVTGDRFAWKDIRYVSSRKAKELFRSNVREGDILAVKIGSVGFSALIDSLRGYDYAIIPANLLRIRVENPAVHVGYIAYVLSSNTGKKKLTDLAGNTAQPALSLAGVRKLSFSVPSAVDEQAAIAAVLSEMDAEIVALERQREKTKAIKQGMMQELLTGRIRLVEPGAHK